VFSFENLTMTTLVRVKDSLVYSWRLFVDVLLFFSLSVYYLTESLVLNFIPRRLRAKDVTSEVVLVTGAGGGIGRLIAQKFAKLGAVVVVWDINNSGKFLATKIILVLMLRISFL